MNGKWKRYLFCPDSSAELLKITDKLHFCRKKDRVRWTFVFYIGEQNALMDRRAVSRSECANGMCRCKYYLTAVNVSVGFEALKSKNKI